MTNNHISSVEVCEVCGADIARDRSRCTNRRCGQCHAKHCTPGGETSSGHGRGNVPTPLIGANEACSRLLTDIRTELNAGARGYYLPPRDMRLLIEALSDEKETL